MRLANCFLLLSTAAGLVAAAGPVKIESGLLNGVEENGIRVFRGIPYAAAPVGELRWRAPQPAPAWKGVRKAEEFGPVCMQSGTRAMSEDCLTLNIWTPAKKDGERLPVMFWIHGGAFRLGAGSFAIYDGGALARQGVLVVTINYRLGDFGIFAHPALTKAQAGEELGNYCLMDQIAALRWVERNIAAFGGDPKQVTIFGESAGGSSVIFLMASPEARGLFQRAIIESGGGTVVPRKPAAQEAQGARLAEDLGVAGDADPIRALRNIPAAEFMKRLEDARGKRGERPLIGAYSPLEDGRIVVGPPAALFEAGKQAPVPLIIGSNSYEGSLMKAFQTTTAQVLALFGQNREEIQRLYGPESKGDNDLLAAKLYGDALFVAGARLLARSMQAVDQPAWLYHDSYVYEELRGTRPGASHGAEIPLVFDNLHGSGAIKAATDADDKMADRVSAYWVRFAKTGNPNPPGREEWPAYDQKTDRLLEFGNDGVAVRANFRKEQLDSLESRWRARKQ
jgi:para-nitrobenzyl esterase